MAQITKGHLPMGAAPALGNYPAGGVNYIVERPAADGLPEVIRILDNNEGQSDPIYISSDEEEVGEIEVVIGGGGEGNHALSSEDENEFGEDEEEEDEDSDEDDEDDEDDDEDDDDDDDDEEEDFSESEDSGYDSMSEDDDDDDIQVFPPEDFLRVWRQVIRPVPAAAPVAGPVGDPDPVAVPQLLIGSQPRVPAHHQERPGPQVEQPEDGLPAVSQRTEETVSSTSGLSSSTKRSREEGCTEQVSAKRQRWNCEENYKDSAPSTSGLSSSTKRSREEGCTEQVSAKRQRWNCEENYKDSAPSTSGLSSSTNRRHWPGPYEYQRWPDDSDSD
ncbi:trigger factor-like [Micropterus dolomieu]|uniref:trigger factor-like n=1 Tax=Micropterus dolomieu TaxID=147949 RepID=UPI001E8DFA51|nr:trigger factor-like [Micropterus dolomieu]